MTQTDNLTGHVITERRHLCYPEDGGVWEWRLLMDPDTLTQQWKPRQVAVDGGEIEPVFMALPGSQYAFFECPIYETLYEGTRGPGKTLTLVMDFAKDVGRGYGESWRGVLFRREYKDLDDVVKKINEWFPKIWKPSEFRMLRSKSEYMAEWASGEALLLRTIEKEEDYDSFHGHELPWQGYEELTQWEDDAVYLKMQSCCRSTNPQIKSRIRATTNPFGVGHAWVKKRFNLGTNERGVVIKKPGEMPRTAIRGVLSENFLLLHADPDYPTKLAQSSKNPNQVRAWTTGDWNVTAGGMFDDLWNPLYHVLPPIPIDAVPPGWIISRSYDHGSSAPFAVGWWLESNGEPIEMTDGRLIGAVRGDLILWKEWYGTSGEPNTGLVMSAKKIAQGICDREEDWGLRTPNGGRSLVIGGPADNNIFNSDADRNNRSLADDMEDEGVDWDRADKSPGSRIRGWQKIRDRLEGSIPDAQGLREEMGLYACSNCPYWIELVPPTPRDRANQDEIPTKYEDHHHDHTRYRITWEAPVLWRKSF